MRTPIAVAAILLVSVSAAPGQDTGGAGQQAFNNRCRTCHSLKSGDNRLGPSLSGVFGRKAGSAPGFPYSTAMKESGLTWDAATLDKFIADPEGVVPDNGMKPYGGITDAGERAKIIAFLKNAR